MEVRVSDVAKTWGLETGEAIAALESFTHVFPSHGSPVCWGLRGARRLAVVQAFEPVRVEPMHPVAQALAVHAANRRRLRTVHPVVDCRDRQQTSHLIGIARRARQAAHISRVIVRSLEPRDHARPQTPARHRARAP